MLHLGEHDPVAGADVGASPGPGNEVDRLGRVADEDDLAPVPRSEVVGNGRPGALVGVGRLSGEGVRPAVDVGVMAALVAVDRLDRGEDALGAGAGVEVDERLVADHPAQRRERVADPLDVEPVGLRRDGFGGAGGHRLPAALRPPPRPPP
jgi:hypothetical protein